jgi:hypothetical protein
MEAAMLAAASDPAYDRRVIRALAAVLLVGIVLAELVTLQERFGSVREFGTRPRRFALSAFSPSEADRCAGGRPAFASQLLELRTRGRGFDALVAVGRTASRARVREALGLLDSLRIRPAP